ncbi:MAG: hypothetical protein EKK54_06080 [Neisseriaceae bacterium]|nr:MAG: hypothetical protein EKK54_06080 [Neisseriaceae bacterium]
MGIIWFGGIATLMLAILAGSSFNNEPLHYTNKNSTVASEVADNLQILAMAGTAYTIDSKLAAATLIPAANLTGYLPQGFSSQLSYSMLFAIDQYQNKWLILSFNKQNYRGITSNSFSEDVLRSLIQKVNNKAVDNQNNYQSVYTGINTNCSLNSNLQKLDGSLQQSFNYVCNNIQGINKYVLMVPDNYY